MLQKLHGVRESCFLLGTRLDNVHADKSLFHICFFYLLVSVSIFLHDFSSFPLAIDVPMSSVAICCHNALHGAVKSQTKCSGVDVYSPPLEARATEPTLLRSVPVTTWVFQHTNYVCCVEDIYTIRRYIIVYVWIYNGIPIEYKHMCVCAIVHDVSPVSCCHLIVCLHTFQ